MRLENRVAIVTGGSKNLGYTYVERFLQEGAAVALADIDIDEGQRAAEKLDSSGEVAFFPVDIADQDSVEAFVAAVVERWGGVDILVNNAAIWSGIEFESADLAYLRKVMDVNMFGTWIVSNAVSPHMVAKGRGRIINVSSIGAFVYLASTVGAVPGLNDEVAASGRLPTFHYNWSKWNIIGLTKLMAGYLGPKGITVNCLLPGASNTESNAAFREGMEAARLSTALQKIVEPSDLADVVTFLASDESALITGHSIFVDAGFHLH